MSPLAGSSLRWRSLLLGLAKVELGEAGGVVNFRWVWRFKHSGIAVAAAGFSGENESGCERFTAKMLSTG